MRVNHLSRREAISRLIKIIGLAAGLSATQVRAFLAQTRRINFDALAKAQALSRETKSLKILVIGTREIYINEFGRAPLMAGSGDLGVIQKCDDFFSPTPSSMQSSSCGKNGCVNQTCGLKSCDENDCSKQNCTGLTCTMYIDSSSKDFLNMHKSDPFVKALFKEFNVTTAEQLSQELLNMMSARR